MSDKEKNKITKKSFKNLPWWSWIFIVACALLPITTLGGAVPSALAVAGVLLCVKLSSIITMKTQLKLLSCFGVVVIAWGFAYLFLWAMVKIMK